VITSSSFSSGTAIVNFTQSASSFAPTITNYEYSTDNGSNWTSLSPAATTSPLTITGLATVPTTILIRAVNSVGNSCPSNNICVPPTAPSASVQTFVGNKTVADLVATGTDLKWYDVATNGTALASTTAIATGTYYVSQTLNSCESDRTSVSVTVTPLSLPGTSSNLIATGLNSGGMIQFTAPTSDGGAPITNYEYSIDNGANWITPSPAITSSPLIISSGLTNCTSYQVKIRAVNAAGTGTESAAVTLVPSTSTIGVNWTTRTSAANNQWLSITYGNGLFVAVAGSGTGNRVMTSPDGINWTARNSAADNTWTSVTYGNGLFVAVSADGSSNQVMTSPDGINWTIRNSGLVNEWGSITYGNGLFVAVATNNYTYQVMTSPDGESWTEIPSPPPYNSWTSVTYGNGLFVAVADGGFGISGNRVMTSTDGITWTERASAADNDWKSVTYGNGLFVAVASSGTGDRVMTSPDGINWTVQTSAADNFWKSVTYGNGFFLAVSADGSSNQVMTSPDGINWTAQTSAANNQWYAVTYGNDLFVAVSADGSSNRVMTSSYSVVANAPVISSIDSRNGAARVFFTTTSSTYASSISNYEYSTDDGVTFTALNPSSNQSPITIGGLINGSTYAVRIRAVNSVGSSCTSAAVSVTPLLGTVPDAPTNLIVTPINTGGKIQFLAPASDGGSPITNYEYSTDNGATWITPSPAITSSSLNIISGLTNCTSYQVKIRAVNAAGSGTESAAVELIPVPSVNVGVNWTQRTSAANNDWTSVTYGNGLFVAVTSTGTGDRVMTSPDGITWTSRTSAADNDWTSVTYGNGLFVAVAQTGTGDRVMTSPDGINWTARASAVDNDWRSVTYENGLFVAVAQTGTGNRVMTSPDGITWTARASALNNNWQSVTYGNGLFVAVANSGNGNRVMTSPDGINWTTRTQATGNQWTSVTYGNGLFVAVGTSEGDNQVMTSPDGITWTAQDVFNKGALASVIYGNGLFVAVSNSILGEQAILSTDGINWSNRAFPATSNWSSVAYGNGIFVVVSNSGNGNIVMTSDKVADAPVITAITPRNNLLTVNFTQANSVNASPVLNYEYSTDNGTTWTTRNPVSTASPIIITGLTNATSYPVKIRAINAAGTSCPSSAFVGTPTLGTVADAPTNLVVVTPINTGGIIQFTPPVNDGGSDITNYEYSTDNGSTWITPSPANTTGQFTISGLTNCTSYQVKIRAVNAAGSGTASSSVQLIPTTSVDMGVNWTARTSAVDNNWQSVTYGNGLFVAVANSGTGNRVMTSSDGITWTARTSAADNNFFGVTYGNGKFVAVSANGSSTSRAMYSTNGIDWTLGTTPNVSSQWVSVTYGNGLFVAVARSSSGGAQVMTSADGINWTLRIVDVFNSWQSVTYGNGLFVAVANTGTGNRVMTSPNGITWTIGTSAANNSWRSVAYGNGLFVAVSSDGSFNRVMTSQDGITWTSSTSAANNQWYSVTYGNGLFVAVSVDGSGNRVMTSPDGINWTSRTSASNNTWVGVTYGNNLFVAVAPSGTGNRVMTSSYNTAADAPVITSATPSINSVSVAFSQTASNYAPAVSNYEYSTDNGSTWTTLDPVSTASPITITGLTTATAYTIKIRAINTVGTSCESTAVSITTLSIPGAPTNLVATGINTGGLIQFTAPANDGGSSITNYEYSTDGGTTWITPSPAITSSPLIIGSGLINCTSYQVKIRAVNAAGTGTESSAVELIPATSEIGVNWTARTSAADNLWRSVTYGNGLFVAVAQTGTGNRVMTSLDGITWMSRTSAADNAWFGVTYGNGVFVAVAANGSGNRVMTSPDGINWTIRTSAEDKDWTSVTYGNGLFVAVSVNSTGNQVMTSQDGIDWTARTSAAENAWLSVTYGNGLFVAVASSGVGNRVMTSPDGINWTAQTSTADNSWNSITYGNGLFVAVAPFGSGKRVMTSPDGIIWTARDAAANNPWASVTYGNGLFIAVAPGGGTGNRVMTSPDGINWTTRTSAADNSWTSVTYGNGRFVAVAASGTGNRVMTSGYGVVADAPVISSAPISQTEASVSFTQSASAFAPAITNYRYSTDGGSSWRNLSPASSTSPITATGITDFANQIQLQAINGVGFSCPASYSLALVAINLNKYGQQSSIPSEFVNKNGARGISGIRATGESRINTPLLSATAAVTSITSTTATSGGTVSADGGDPVTARGVCWSTTSNPTTADNKTIDGTGVGTFTSAITGLASGTTYYVRSYATNSMGTTYGPEIIFRTL
jgi:hypothetical protein